MATPDGLKRIAAEQAEAAAAAAAAKAKAEASKEKVTAQYGKGMIFEMQPEERVTAALVVAELARATKVVVAEEDVELPAIDELPGSAIATVTFHPEVKMSLKVEATKSKITFG